MPYIRKSQREELDVGRLPADEGELNYVITRLVDDYVRRQGLRYATLNQVVGALVCAKDEFYRRVVAPYESTKIAVNGDVYHCMDSDPDIRVTVNWGPTYTPPMPPLGEIVEPVQDFGLSV